MGNFSCRENPYYYPQILIMGTRELEVSTHYEMRGVCEANELIPTIDVCMKTFSTRGIDLSGWDVGGRDTGAFLQEGFNQYAVGHVFLVDSSNQDRMKYAFEGFILRCLSDEATKNTLVMILANNHNLPNALTCQQVEENFWKTYGKAPKTYSDHKIMFRPCSLETGEDLTAAFQDFVCKLEKMKAKRRWQARIKALKTSQEREDKSLKFFMRKPVGFIKNLLMH